MSLDALANAYVEWETDTADADNPRAVGAEKAVLHHIHLPLLDAASFLDYDPDATSITPADDAIKLVDSDDLVDQMVTTYADEALSSV